MTLTLGYHGYDKGHIGDIVVFMDERNNLRKGAAAWVSCPGCGKERSATWDTTQTAFVLKRHRRWSAMAREMFPCKGGTVKIAETDINSAYPDKITSNAAYGQERTLKGQ